MRYFTINLYLFFVFLFFPVQVYAACTNFFVNGQPPITPMTTRQSCFQYYALGASDETLGNIWSAEHLTMDQIKAANTIPRKGKFDRFETQFRSYKNSGYDRGHMAPSGNMPSFSSQEETFRFDNIVPQTKILNSGKWNWIEHKIRRLTLQYKEVYVVTGPVFFDIPKTIGIDHIWVPQAVWKAIYIPSIAMSGVYLCYNTNRPVCYIVSVSFFTDKTGIDPFPGLPSEIKDIKMHLPKPRAKPSSLQ